MSRHKIAAVLSNYIPEATVDECTSWIIQKNIHLKITKGRASKFGDYKPLEKGKGHHISCLLYTSDAADERSSVDLGGRRIIKKKKK